MTDGLLFDIQRFALHDGPGIRTTVFFKGCGLRCWWCHNPESQHPKQEVMLRPELCIQCGACLEACPEGAIIRDGDRLVTLRDRCTGCGACAEACNADARQIVGRAMAVAAVMAEVMRDSLFYEESGGGVTFSGGEPLLQGDFLLALLRACKAQDLHTTLDTCGHAPTATLEAVRPYVDLFLYDLKLMDDARHRQVTGASNKLILEHLHLLARGGHRIVLRIPLIPGINDDEENLRQIATLVRTLPQIERVDLLPYHLIGDHKYERLNRPNPMPETLPPTPAQMENAVRIFRDAGVQVSTGG